MEDSYVTNYTTPACSVFTYESIPLDTYRKWKLQASVPRLIETPDDLSALRAGDRQFSYYGDISVEVTLEMLASSHSHSIAEPLRGIGPLTF